MGLETVGQFRQGMVERIGRVIIGQAETVRLALVALLSEGHLLLEGVPGTAKTLLARAFSASLALEFKRIQFTPDLMPGDVIGTNLFDFQTGRFAFVKGPIFTELLLADEINRTPPKTQAALLEAMQERCVTIDGKTSPLSPGFMVVATQNPIEQEGTYPLPEAQLDRFLFKVSVTYPDLEEELRMVATHGHQRTIPDLAALGVTPIGNLSVIEQARAAVRTIRLSEEIVRYVVDLVRATRSNPALRFGASPRAANMLALATRAAAACEGREYAVPDDVKSLFLPAMRHRVVLGPTAELEGKSADDVLRQILDQTRAPR